MNKQNKENDRRIKKNNPQHIKGVRRDEQLNNSFIKIYIMSAANLTPVNVLRTPSHSEAQWWQHHYERIFFIRLVRNEEKMDYIICTEIIEGNQFRVFQRFETGMEVHLQAGLYDPEHTIKATLG